jgi:hypothetical protein
MKKFCNIVVQNGNRNALGTLERVLNSEVSVRTTKQNDLLNQYKEVNHEIDQNVLAQPAF